MARAWELPGAGAEDLGADGVVGLALVTGIIGNSSCGRRTDSPTKGMHVICGTVKIVKGMITWENCLASLLYP